MRHAPRFINLGPIPYAPAFAEQQRHAAEVLASRERGAPEVGRILFVEHVPPVITVSRREGSVNHLLASREMLAAMGVELHETDRGGDITYHGPGQLVVYPILDLNLLGLGLHAYMRMLEEIVIRTVARFGIVGVRDASATGVWVEQGCATDLSAGRCASDSESAGTDSTDPRTGRWHSRAAGAKLCAMGVRVKRWVSMHGLALNVTTNLEHFNLIVPCGLVGRPVTSVSRLLGASCPLMHEVEAVMMDEFARATAEALDAVANRTP